MGNINIKGSKLGNGTVIIGGNIKNSSIERIKKTSRVGGRKWIEKLNLELGTKKKRE